MLSPINHLLLWCPQNGIHISDQLCVKQTERGGISIYSKDAFISANETLVTIPADAVISIKASFLSDEHELSNATYGIDAQLALSCALYAEILRGEDSPWFGYLQSLPTMDLPYFWEGSHDAMCWLRRTRVIDLLLCAETGDLVSEQVRRYFEESAQPILCKYFSAVDVTLQGFQRAFSLVSSRAFLVDAYHGLAMVPIADAFNHITENHVHLQSEYNVCPVCGSINECAHDQDNPPSTAIAPPSTSPHEEAYYEMVSNTAIPPHSEVFNTYGDDLDDAKLFVQYGFMLEDNDLNRTAFTLNELHRFDVQPQDNTEDWLTESMTCESQMIQFNLNEKEPWSIDADGKISHQLWLVCLPDSLGKRRSNGKQMWQAQLAVERGHAPSLECRSLLLQLANKIISLCRTAILETMGNGSTEEANSLLDNSPDSRLRLALTYFLTEQSIMNSCRERWEEFRDDLKGMFP